jgi:hypothetical protein
MVGGLPVASGPNRTLDKVSLRCGAARQTGLSLQVQSRACSELTLCRTKPTSAAAAPMSGLPRLIVDCAFGHRHIRPSALSNRGFRKILSSQLRSGL